MSDDGDQPVDDITDPGFVDDLKASQEAVWAAARWLHSQGKHVVVRALRIRPNAARKGEYADAGDLEVLQRVEVKRRFGVRFTGAEDFPFSTIIVDVVHTWDNADPKPDEYLIFNERLTACAVVHASTADRWEKTRRFDKHLRRERDFYECPVELVDFHAVAPQSPPGPPKAECPNCHEMIPSQEWQSHRCTKEAAPGQRPLL